MDSRDRLLGFEPSPFLCGLGQVAYLCVLWLRYLYGAYHLPPEGLAVMEGSSPQTELEELVQSAFLVLLGGLTATFAF